MLCGFRSRDSMTSSATTSRRRSANLASACLPVGPASALFPLASAAVKRSERKNRRKKRLQRKSMDVVGQDEDKENVPHAGSPWKRSVTSAQDGDCNTHLQQVFMSDTRRLINKKYGAAQTSKTGFGSTRCDLDTLDRCEVSHRNTVMTSSGLCVNFPPSDTDSGLGSARTSSQAHSLRQSSKRRLSQFSLSTQRNLQTDLTTATQSKYYSLV